MYACYILSYHNIFLGYYHPKDRTKRIYKITLKVINNRIWIAFKYYHKPEKDGQQQGEGEENDGAHTAEPPGKTEKKPARKKQITDRRICLCPIQRGQFICGYERAGNNSALQNHSCPLLESLPLTSVYGTASVDYNPFQLLSTKPTTAQNTLQDLSTRLLTYMLSGTPISHNIVGSKSFQLFIYALIHLGQLFPEMEPHEIFPLVTRKRVPVLMNTHATDALIAHLQKFRNRFVSLIFDAGELYGTHTLSVCLCLNEHSERPTFLQLCHGPWNKNDYILCLNQLLSMLDAWKIKVVSICTDGLRAQVEAIHSCQRRLQSGKPLGRFSPVLIPFHVPCMNHKINNVMNAIFQDHPTATRVLKIIQTFSSMARKQDNRKIFSTRCPGFIPTRWFYIAKIAAYIRLHRIVILEHQLLDPQSLLDVLKIELLLVPLIELHLFFEDHLTKLSHAYPAIIRALWQYLLLLQSSIFSNGEWLNCCIHCMVTLYNRTLTGSIGSLLELSFSVSPSGRRIFRSGERAVGYHPAKSLADNKKIAEISTVYYSHGPLVPLETNIQHRTHWRDAFLTLSQLLAITKQHQSAKHDDAQPSAHAEITDSHDTPNTQQTSEPTTVSTPVLDDDDDDALFGKDIVDGTEMMELSSDSETDNSEPTSSHSADGSQKTSRKSFCFNLPQPAYDPTLHALDLFNFPLTVPALSEGSETSEISLLTEPLTCLNNINTTVFKLCPELDCEKGFMTIQELLLLYQYIESDLAFPIYEIGYEDEKEETEREGKSDSSDSDYEAFLQRDPTRKAVKAKRKTPKHFRYPKIIYDDSSDSNVEEKQKEEEEIPEVIVVSATSTIEHSIPSTGTQVKEDQEWLTVMNIFASIRKWPPDLLETKFDEFLRQTLPPIVLGSMKTEIMRIYSRTLLSDTEYEELSAVESQLLFDIRNCSPKRLFGLIVSSLNHSSCSECESERVFSIAGHICPPRRNRLALMVINHSLLIHLAEPPYVPQNRADLSVKAVSTPAEARRQQDPM